MSQEDPKKPDPKLPPFYAPRPGQIAQFFAEWNGCVTKFCMANIFQNIPKSFLLILSSLRSEMGFRGATFKSRCCSPKVGPVNQPENLETPPPGKKHVVSPNSSTSATGTVAEAFGV